MTMKAFPNMTNQQGMELRDYFAAKAMQALVNNKDINQTVKEIKNPDVLPRLVSGMAYEIADAMMKAREQ
jgi:hypothetical protein